MKSLFSCVFFTALMTTGFAQGVKVGETPGAPHQSAILEMESTSKGLLPPRMTTAERDLIADPAEGLQIYNTDTKCLNMWVGTSWKKACFDCDFDNPTPLNDGPVCEGGTLHLSSGLLPGATYEWAGPNGFTSSLQNPVVENVTSLSGGAYTLTVTLSGCTSQPRTTVASVKPIPAEPVVSNSGPACLGSTAEFSVNPESGASYSWTGPNGFAASGLNPGITNVQPSDAGTYFVSATVDGCVSSAAGTDLGVITTPDQPSAISGPVQVCAGVSGLEYFVEEISGVTYTWTAPVGWSVVSGQGTPSITAQSSGSGGSVQVTPSNSCGSGTSRSLSVSISDYATGGTVTQIPGYQVHTFTSSGTFHVACALSNVEVLVVAGGGGGGGGWEGAGGGAGGVVYNGSYAVSEGQDVNVIVGNGGTGGNGSLAFDATNGQNSEFGTTYAIGGGGGGSLYGATGSPGGSGGGSPWGKTPGSGAPGQGNAGGTSTAGQYVGGGGGGGAGAVGGNLTGPSAGGVGGIGIQYSISGSPTYYGGGGGGSAQVSYNPPGGLGGGGTGSCESPTPTTPTSGQANTGGGGGASRVNNIPGGNGGSGIVIVRYVAVN